MIGKPQSEQHFCSVKNVDTQPMNLLLPGSCFVQAMYRIFGMLDFHCFGKTEEKVSGAPSSIL